MIKRLAVAIAFLVALPARGQGFAETALDLLRRGVLAGIPLTDATVTLRTEEFGIARNPSIAYLTVHVPKPGAVRSTPAFSLYLSMDNGRAKSFSFEGIRPGVLPMSLNGAAFRENLFAALGWKDTGELAPSRKALEEIHVVEDSTGARFPVFVRKKDGFPLRGGNGI